MNNNEFLKNNIRYIGIGGCGLGIISLFMPFATVSATAYIKYSKSVDFISGSDGKLVLLALLVTAIFFFLKKDVVSVIGGGIAALITMYDGSKINDLVGTYSSSYVKVSFGVGFYILVLALIVVIGAALLSMLVFNKKVKVGSGYANPQLAQQQMMVQQQPMPQQPQYMGQQMMPQTQPVQQPMVQPQAQPMQQPMVQPQAQPMQQPMMQPQAQPMQQPMMQPQAQPMQQPMVQPQVQVDQQNNQQF